MKNSFAQRIVLPCGTGRLSFLVGTFEQVITTLMKPPPQKGRVILPCPLYDLSRVQQDPALAAVYSQVDFCTTDGVPLVWWFRTQMSQPIERAYGPDMMRAVYARTLTQRHLILCPNPEALRQLQKKLRPQLQKKTTHLELVGDSKDQGERQRLATIIRRFKPHHVWIGVGSPNQVMLGMYLKKELKMACNFWCVGAAISFLAGTVAQAPRWMQQNGLEWLFRLLAEPGRLWQRYLVDTPLFLFRVLFARIRGT